MFETDVRKPQKLESQLSPKPPLRDGETVGHALAWVADSSDPGGDGWPTQAR